MGTSRKLAAACVLLSSPAWAGEVTGNGDPTPIANHVASSECAFSGLQDGTAPIISTQVQNWGAIVASLRGLPPLPGPGVRCRGK